VYVCKSKGEIDIRSGVTWDLIPCTPSILIELGKKSRTQDSLPKTL